MAPFNNLVAWALLAAAASAVPQASSISAMTTEGPFTSGVNLDTTTLPYTVVSDQPFSFGDGEPDDTSTTDYFSFASYATLAVTSSVIITSGPVVTFTIAAPWGDQLQAASLIGIESDLTTMAVSCASPVGPQECEYTAPITMTAGPSTLHWSIEYDEYYTVDEYCSYSSEGASCTWTAEGIASAFPHSGPDITATGRSTSISSQTFRNVDLTAVPVIVTAGDSSGVSTGTITVTDAYPVEASSVASTETSSILTSASQATASTSDSSQSASSSARITPASTKTSNDAAVLAPGAAVAGLLGLLAYVL